MKSIFDFVGLVCSDYDERTYENTETTVKQTRRKGCPRGIVGVCVSH